VDILEDALTSAEGFEISSTSRLGQANITVEFDLKRTSTPLFKMSRPAWLRHPAVAWRDQAAVISKNNLRTSPSCGCRSANKPPRSGGLCSERPRLFQTVPSG
jgi:hypothetical protein